MPTATRLAAIQNSLSQIKPPTSIQPLASRAQANAQNNPVVTGVKQDPGTQARMSTARTGLSGSGEAGAQQAALQQKLGSIGNWSSQITALKQQAAATRAANTAKLREQQTQAAVPPGQSRRVVVNGKDYGEASFANKQIPNVNGASGTRQKIVQEAYKMLGTPYAWGGGGIGNRGSRGTGLGTQNVIGVDCSGLTSYVYGLIGMKLPRYSNNQTAQGVRTNIKNAQPGDLVGWGRGGHVAIYIGDGMIIESPKPGTQVRTRKLGAGESVYAVRLKLPGD